jgi:hypothetical protein
MIRDFYTRFEDLPACGARRMGYVYILRFSTETIKVGSTQNARDRISTHRSTAAAFGAELTDLWVTHCFDLYQYSERRLLSVASSMATRRYGNEWFTGVAFQDLVALAPALTYAAEENEELRADCVVPRRVVEDYRVARVHEALARTPPPLPLEVTAA